MMFPRPRILHGCLATLVGLVIGCSLGLSARSQETNLNQQTPPLPVVEPPGLTAPVADPIQRRALPSATTLPANGPTLEALAQSVNPLWVIPVASLSAIADRPIFWPSRRPVRSASPASVEPGPLPFANQRPPFALIGAVAGETDGIGIFRDETTKNVVRLKTQESLAGWTLNLVKGREATLQRGGEIAVLEIPNP
jgi:hypothetical protein